MTVSLARCAMWYQTLGLVPYAERAFSQNFNQQIWNLSDKDLPRVSERTEVKACRASGGNSGYVIGQGAASRASRHLFDYARPLERPDLGAKRRAGPGCPNRFSASISGASAGVRLPSG